MQTASTERPATMDALTADGNLVHLRSVVPADADPLAGLFQHATPAALRTRFFGVPSPTALAGEVERLVRPAGPDHDVVVAVQNDVPIGVASYERDGSAPRAEFAVFVAAEQHGRGVGTLLLEFLAARARARGIAELTGMVLASNGAMLQVVKGLGERAAPAEAGVIDVVVRTAADEMALTLLDERDRTARSASLRPLLAPRSVAVVGAGRKEGGIGHSVLQAMRHGDFAGSLYAVNPHAESILGVPTVASISDLPRPLDLVVICVPAPAVPAVLTEAGECGVRAAVIITAGFSEAGASGKAAQQELLGIARQYGIRVVGPNCIGVLNTDSTVRLSATFAGTLPPAGGLALASQSGAVGIAVLDHAARTGCGVSSFVSLGNKLDVSSNDLLSYWFDDPATSAVALYLESFGNPRRFARIARALARRKPVIAVVSGRSAAGRRAGASHTAAAASPAVAVEALCAQAGIIRVDHLGELLDVARVVTDQPLPAGPRLGLVGNAGGVNVLAVDAAEPAGLVVPDFSDELRQRLHDVVPNAANPLDLGAGANPESFETALRLMADSGEVDALIAVLAVTAANDVPGTLATFGSFADKYPQLPFAVVLLGADGAVQLGGRGVPVFALPERAVSALGKAAAYAQWRQAPLGGRPPLPSIDSAVAHSVVRAGLAAGGGWQPHGRIAEILGRYGIPMAPTVTAVGEHAVTAQAARLGFPVVVKAADPQLVHKSDIGGVRVGLGSAQEVGEAYRAIAAALGVAEPPVLVQPMVSGAAELVAGIVHDPLFGSLVMTGLGGVHTDLFADRAFRLVPVTDRDAATMWRSLRAAPLLTGYRGKPPVNTAAVEDLLLRLGRLAEDRPEIAELDLNPIIVSAEGAVVVDAKMRLAEVSAEPDPALRNLASR